MSYTVFHKHIADLYRLGPVEAKLMVIEWIDDEEDHRQTVVFELYRRGVSKPLKPDQFAICDLPIIEKLLSWAFPRMEEIYDDLDRYL